jgi:hypothetical protein
MSQMVGIALIAVALIVAGNWKFGWLYRFQEWRYGRKVDQTVEWEAFTAAFKDEE